ncbi:MAG: hypothetical protein HY200_10155 [Nitrospirae bacterium]|nr:hypothetical protein [Nitrospirota bacterium]MBI3595307.1 hypothetical protein [Nitrospirota bacterium]
MDLSQRIVVRFQDGKVLKGTTQDFFPNKDRFHLNQTDGESFPVPVEISLTQVKAVFFVKDYKGNKEYQAPSGFEGSSQSQYGKKAMIHFKDGEILYGYTQGFSPGRLGFFLFPHDANSNNLKVYIVQAFVSKLEFPK